MTGVLSVVGLTSDSEIVGAASIIALSGFGIGIIATHWDPASGRWLNLKPPQEIIDDRKNIDEMSDAEKKEALKRYMNWITTGETYG